MHCSESSSDEESPELLYQLRRTKLAHDKLAVTVQE